MPATTEPSQELLERTRRQCHGQCLACGAPDGLGLRFAVRGDGSVEATFACPQRHQGYPDILHGGVTSALLDSAMTNCLFARGLRAVTAELTVRFRHPVRLGRTVLVRARLTRSQTPLHVLAAELIQDGQVRATAEGKFMEVA